MGVFNVNTNKFFPSMPIIPEVPQQKLLPAPFSSSSLCRFPFFSPLARIPLGPFIPFHSALLAPFGWTKAVRTSAPSCPSGGYPVSRFLLRRITFVLNPRIGCSGPVGLFSVGSSQ